MKKSITILGKTVDCAYVIRDVNIDVVTIEKYSVKCTNDIESAWGTDNSINDDEQKLEVKLEEKISNTTLKAKPNVIEIAAKSGGKIIKDFVTEKTKRGKIVYLTDLVFFKTAEEIENVEKNNVEKNNVEKNNVEKNNVEKNVEVENFIGQKTM